MNTTRPTQNLGDVGAWPFEDGAQEVRVRASRHEDGVPVAFQAWVIPARADLPRVVAVRANPVAAIDAVLNRFYTAVSLRAEGKDVLKYSLDTGRLIDPDAREQDEEDWDPGLDDLL